MRAALYHRVSTIDQNPAGARRELRRAAKALGARVVLEVEETGSGANNDRPGLLRVLAAAHRRELDAVIVWKVDRFARSSFDLLSRLRELEGCGVRFVATTQGLDVRPGGDATSRLVLQVLAAVAEWERDTIRERTRVGVAAARARGATIGRPEVELPAVVDVTRLLELGRGRKAIARELGVSEWAVRRVIAGLRRVGRAASSEKKGGPSRRRKSATARRRGSSRTSRSRR